MAPIAGWLWPLEGPSGTSVGVGLLEEVGWAILLALVLLLWVVRRLRRRKSEEERRAVAEGNRRKARRLYEEAFGKGDFSVIDEAGTRLPKNAWRLRLPIPTASRVACSSSTGEGRTRLVCWSSSGCRCAVLRVFA